MTSYDVVVPTIGRASLRLLLGSLAAATGPLPESVIVVDDRRDRSTPLDLGPLGPLAERTYVVAGAARGPATARNRGWYRARAPWVAFLDDDVVVAADWRAALAADLAACDASCAGTTGRVTVPLDPARRPNDWERNVRGLETARYITADCAYRREILRELDGFDERFPRAYREDAELALRVFASGRTIRPGARRIDHPVRPADAWVSVRLQAGNADDALMRALHGPDWRERVAAGRGSFSHHVATVAAAGVAAIAALGWATLAARFAWRRIAPGPRDPREIATMLVTSVAIPFAAVAHRTRGTLGVPGALARGRRLPAAVFFDRDGTLVDDDPTLADPLRLTLVPGAREALARLRGAGIAIGVVTNQHRVADGSLDATTLDAIHARLEELAGPFATIRACTHARDAGCACRKPEPGLVVAAARDLGLEPAACLVVGDIGSDMDAARAAGARAILVPTPVTRANEIASAPLVARDLAHAAELILSGAA
ncbi:MAG: HAD-IIIA family hydrolase [Vulcanimicrobiaceae bacterium]